MEIKADRNLTISELKVAHCMKFTDLKKLHASAIKEKNHRIKGLVGNVADMSPHVIATPTMSAENG